MWRKALGRVVLATCAVAGAILSCGVEKDPAENVDVAHEALITTKSFQQSVLPTGAYSGATDATLRESNPPLNDDTADICGVDGDNGGGVDKSCVIRWDVSEIPAGSSVTDASITFYLVDGGNQSYGIYELVRTWDATQVSWNVASTGQNWATPGANGATDRGALLGSVSGATGSTQVVQLNATGRARVRAWIDNPSSNAGVIIANTTNAEGIDVASSDHATPSLRPKLTVTYDTGGGGTGGTGSGGTGSGGVAGYPDLIVAFIGDQGNNEDAQAVLALIKNEGAQAVVHNGDFDYANSPSGWVTMIDGGLDASFPYFAVFGNHEGAVQTGYAQALANRANGIPEMRDNCTGTYGYNTSCNFRGIRIVQSCVGLGELDPIRCGKDAAQPINHIHDSLANDNSIWSICNWHKVQAQMTVGDNTDEAGWQAYQECMNAGAIVITAHNHTYSRSYTLTDIANTNVSANKGAIGTHDVMQVGPGRTFALVVGIGGRALYTRKAAPEAWWASYYTDTRWRQSGTTGDGLLSPSGKQGALFIKFNAGGDPRRAEAWVKDVTPITPRIMDTFTIQAL